MRRLRTMSVLLFIVALILLGVHVYRDRIVKDQTGPVFTMDSNTIEISVKDGEDALLKGLVVTDAGDGDVTDSVIVESVSPFTGTGHRIVNYAACDSDNHVTHAKRDLIYTDYTDPRFHFDKPLAFAMNVTNIFEGITVEDCIDGDISRNIKLMADDDFDTSHVGNYSARLKVTNSAGGVSYLPVTIEIYDASIYYRRPQIKLSDYVVYVEQGSEFSEIDYLHSVVINGTEYRFTDEKGTYGASYLSANETDNTVNYDWIDIESDVDTDITGCYEVLYSLDDTENGSGTGEVRMYVIVIEGGRE